MATAVMYNKNTPLMRVRIKKKRVSGIIELINPGLLPIILQNGDRPPDITKVNDWIRKRMIPEERIGLKAVRETFKNFRTGGSDMASLSDQYWFQYNEGQRWEEINFFTNAYDENTGRAFFTPWEMEKDQKFGRSPDYSTNGLLKKTWKRQEDGTSRLIKAGSRELHQEPVTEVLASEMLRKLDIVPYVKYSLVIEGMTLCSSCRNFVDENTEFVPASHIFRAKEKDKNVSNYHHLLNMCDVFGVQGAKEFIDNMITADRILGNDDRHLGNFGFLRDANTGNILGFAPIFDSGSAYGGKANRQGIQRLFEEKQVKASIRAAAKRIDYKKMCDHEDMFELIRMYPNIDREQKEYIKVHILNTEKEIGRLMRRSRRQLMDERSGR